MTRYELGSTLLSIVSALFAGYALYTSSKLSEEGIYVTAINTRISTCMGLSTYHRENVEKPSEAVKSASESNLLSPPKVRGERAADIARALTLCLVDYENIDGVRLCVRKANENPEHLVHDIIQRGSGGAPDTMGATLAC